MLKPLVALSLFACTTLLACQQPLSPQPTRQQIQTARNFKRGEGLRQGVIQMRRLRFDKWDIAPRDNALTRQEASDKNLTLPNGLINGFADYDLNQDGRISFDEFLREEVLQFWMDLYFDIVDNEFAIYDLNNNSQLEGPELLPLRDLFGPWPELHSGDLNQDGWISFDEFETAYMRVAPYLKQKRNLPQA